MNTINNLLDFTPETYEQMFWDTYFEWCMDFVTNSENDLQKVLANKAINAYFRKEYAKCEADFMARVKPYLQYSGLSSIDYRNLYSECTYLIFSRYPKPLLSQARKLNITNMISLC